MPNIFARLSTWTADTEAFVFIHFDWIAFCVACLIWIEMKWFSESRKRRREIYFWIHIIYFIDWFKASRKNTSHWKRNSLCISFSSSHVGHAHNLQYIFLFTFSISMVFLHWLLCSQKTFFSPLLSFQLRFLNEIHLMYRRKWGCIHGTSCRSYSYITERRWESEIRKCEYVFVRSLKLLTFYTSLCCRCCRRRSQPPCGWKRNLIGKCFNFASR